MTLCESMCVSVAMEDFEAVLDVFLNENVAMSPSTRYSNALIIAESLRKAVRKDGCIPPVTSIVSLIDECVKKQNRLPSVEFSGRKRLFFQRAFFDCVAPLLGDTLE